MCNQGNVSRAISCNLTNMYVALPSMCLQIISWEVGSIGEFLSAALQPPEP
ncbi:hypothetical protein Lser_V15G34434 [Lactuca serriola]